MSWFHQNSCDELMMYHLMMYGVTPQTKHALSVYGYRLINLDQGFFFSFCSGLQQHANVHSWQLPAALYIVGVYQVYRLGLLHDGYY